MQKQTTIQIAVCIQINWIKPSRKSMLSISADAYTHTFVTQKPEGSNNAKAHLPKFWWHLILEKGEMGDWKQDLSPNRGLVPLKLTTSVVALSSPGIHEFCSENSPPWSLHVLILCEPLQWCFMWVFVPIWGLHASSICNRVSFPPTELALALIYLRVQISPCLLLKASTSSQNLFLLLEIVPPHHRDTNSTRAMRRGDLLLTVWAAVAVPTMEVTARITGTNSTPPLDSPDLRRTKGKAPLSSACGSLKDGQHDNIMTY